MDILHFTYLLVRSFPLAEFPQKVTLFMDGCLTPLSSIGKRVRFAGSTAGSFPNATFATFADSYLNPVVNSNHPDPGILALPDNAGYVVVSTSHFNSKSGPAFPILFSTNLVDWEHVSKHIT